MISLILSFCAVDKLMTREFNRTLSSTYFCELTARFILSDSNDMNTISNYVGTV